MFLTLLTVILPSGTSAGVINIIESKETPYALENRGKYSAGQGDVRVGLSGSWNLDVPSESTNQDITVPFCWDNWAGDVVLSRKFTIADNLAEKRCRLIIDGFGQNIAATLNGVHLDSRNGDGLTALIDIQPEVLRFGPNANELILKISNRLSKHTDVPLAGSVYARRRYGGVFNDIYILASPIFSVSSLEVTVKPISGSQDAIIAQAELRGKPQSSRSGENEQVIYLIKVYDNENSLIAETAQRVVQFPTSGIVNVSASLNISGLARWDGAISNNPPLYRVVCELSTPRSIHTMATLVGVRQLDLTTSGFRINGQSRWLKCISYIPAHPTYGVIGSSRRFEADVSLIKRMGADAVRIVQGPAPLAFLDMCDRYGLLVFEEIPVFQSPDPILAEADFIRSASDQLETMIRRDRQFTCIAGWGIASEINQPNSINADFYRTMVDLAHSLDRRPVYAALPFTENLTAAPLDFVILELTPYRTDMIRPIPLTITSDRPTLAGGIRMQITPGNLGGWADLTSEAGQAYYLVNRVQSAKRSLWACGTVVGDFTDWAGVTSSIYLPFSDPGIYSSGMTDRMRQARLSYTRLSEYWNSGALPSLNRGTAPSTDEVFLVLMGIGLILLLFLVMYQNHLFKQNLVRSVISVQGFFQDISDRRYTQSATTALVGLLASASLALVEIGWFSANRQTYALDWLLGYFFGDSSIHQGIAQFIWKPWQGFLFFCLVNVAALYLAAFLNVVLGRIFHRRCSLLQAVDFSCWSAVVCLALLPVGVVAHRMFLADNGFLVFFFTAICLIWSLVRIIIVIAQHTRQSYLKIAILWLLLPIGLVFTSAWLINDHYYLSEYWGFFWGTIANG